MRQFAVTLAFCLLAAWPARAEESAEAPPSPALSLIAAAQAEGVFTAVDGASTHVRHTASGLLCRFQSDGAGARIILVPGLPRGDDVACEFAGEGRNIRLYATRLPVRAALADIADAAGEALRRSAPNASAYGAPLELAASAAAPASRGLQFILPGEDGARDYLVLFLAQRGAWTYKLRYRAPVANEDDIARQRERAELIWRGALSDLSP